MKRIYVVMAGKGHHEKTEYDAPVRFYDNESAAAQFLKDLRKRYTENERTKVTKKGRGWFTYNYLPAIAVEGAWLTTTYWIESHPIFSD